VRVGDTVGDPFKTLVSGDEPDHQIHTLFACWPWNWAYPAQQGMATDAGLAVVFFLI